ncbi:Uncharacterized conserved protein, DUF1778 family [Marinobacter salarius]|uniref:Uncharacterized conserved protein, DUF1778 family n=1 Tax=Marinobacter salarius TaxID=1420917 RepID=A0ABY1FRJ4_9GAMM|nr:MULTISPECIES: DUF1778 domain-containing protein [Marinobacter]KXJ44959.1 MAG: hypothetical protein AXW11_14310 [Marinobacter sp. Hex_13]SFL93656.1 Uncharacterized conserved protein, DUF1778 family [Marinobacter salarius]
MKKQLGNGSTDPRIVARVSTETQRYIAQAAELTGVTLSQFVIESSMSRAERVIDQMTRIKVTVETGNRMLNLMDRKPRKPRSSKLIQDALDYKETIDASETYTDSKET